MLPHGFPRRSGGALNDGDGTPPRRPGSFSMALSSARRSDLALVTPRCWARSSSVFGGPLSSMTDCAPLGPDQLSGRAPTRSSDPVRRRGARRRAPRGTPCELTAAPALRREATGPDPPTQTRSRAEPPRLCSEPNVPKSRLASRIIPHVRYLPPPHWCEVARLRLRVAPRRSAAGLRPGV